MIASLLALLGGTAFRLFLGGVLDFFTKKADASTEMDKMRLQADLDDRAHKNKLEELGVAAQQGIQQVQVQGALASQAIVDNGWVETIKGINDTAAAIKPTGKWWIDVIPTLIMSFNQVIRPTLAAVAITLWFLSLYKAGFKLTDWDQGLVASVLGVFIGDRIHAKQQGQ